MTRARIEQMPEDDWRKHDERFNEPELSENLALSTAGSSDSAVPIRSTRS